MVAKKRAKTSSLPPLPTCQATGKAGKSDNPDHLALLSNQLQSITSCLPCITFEMSRDRSGNVKFIAVSGPSQKLLQRSTEDLQASFARFLEIIEPTAKLRLEEAIAMSATKRSVLAWDGKLRNITKHGGKQKTKWIRLRASVPKKNASTSHWIGLIADITLETELDIALKRSRDQFSELSAYLEAGKEEERERIARDIHDELGSLLVAIKIEASLLSSKLPEKLDSLRQKARSIEILLDQAMGTASRVARELRPGILKEFGLSAALECQAEDFSQRTGITCRAQCDQEIHDVEERYALAIFRIVQEALTNVAKHAHASLVALRLYRDTQHLVLEIRDNGRGIGEPDLHKPKSFGLRGIRERARSLNGQLHIGPGEQGGTHIVLSLPLRRAANRAATENDVQHTLF